MHFEWIEIRDVGIFEKLFKGALTSLNPCDTNIARTLKLVDEMIKLSDDGDIERQDVGCGILYGTLRDSAYKIKKLAEKEKENHIKKGWWNQNQE